MGNIGGVAAALLVAVTGLSSVGSVQAPKPKVLTTSSGVYTSRQASRGEQTYMSICVSCHPPGTYSSPAFREKWNGAPLADLFSLISQTMPKQEPASLTPEEYADVLSYMLKINGAPPGKQELPAAVEPLKKIRIHMGRSK